MINSVSCSSDGNCAAGGYYQDSSGNTQAFVASEAAGVWGTPSEVGDDAGEIDSGLVLLGSQLRRRRAV